jgi:phosphotransferase system IIB component
MQEYIYYIIGAVVFIIALSVFLFLKKKTPKKQVELPGILELIDKNNVKSVDFIRNKIVITFIDVTLFDSNQLHHLGAKGISIVGDKVKFYFDGEEDLNHSIYSQIKNHIER